jgi:hypothetical protein
MFEWITNDIKIEVMIKVMIKKNDETIKVMECMESTLQHTFNLAHDIAGGMWNGKDKFKVIINK